MERDSSSNNQQGKQRASQESEPLGTQDTDEQALSQRGSLPSQPVHNDPTVQTQGGAYITGGMINMGGVNVVGGQVGTINYYESAPSPSSNPSRPNNYIPFPRNPLFQPRPGEFEELESLLFAPGAGPKRLGLEGMGGVGKTQLAVELVYRCLDQQRFAEGIFWFTATGNADDWRVALAKLALATDYFPPDDKPSEADNELRRVQYLCRYLASHSQALLVLDNVDDPSLVMSVLPALAGGEIACSIWYTSRVTRVPPGVTAYSVSRLPQEAAVRLLLASTRPALLREILQGRESDEAEAARVMCDVVGYLPLALVHLRAVLNDDQDILLTALLAALREQGALEVTNDLDPDATSLIATFRLSWEKVKYIEAQRLFKLAAYFPEATPIPLKLLGLAAGLGEKTEGFTPLGKMWIRLQQLSLLEKLSKDQVRLHPLVRAFGQRLVTEDGDKGQALVREAAELLVSEFTHLNKLEQRALQGGYYSCLEQVRAVRDYLERLGATAQAEQVEWIEQWLGRESYVLGDGQWWPEKIPGLFYQQLFNRTIEAGQEMQADRGPVTWLRLTTPTNAEDQALLLIFTGHSSSINSVAFSPDGQQVLTGSHDKTARVWDTISGKLLRTLEGHATSLTSVAFSPDGRLILTGSADQTARVWDKASGELLRKLEGHTDRVTSVAFSPDGSMIVTGSADKTARLWKTEDGKPLKVLENHNVLIWSVAFSLDGREVLTGSEDGMARIWDIVAGKVLVLLEGHTGPVRSVAFSPDGGRILTGSNDGTARLWKTVDGSVLAVLEGHIGPVRSVAFSPDGSKVLTSSNDGTARLWRTVDGNVLAVLRGHRDWVTSVAFSPDGSKLLTGSEDRTARLWRTVDARILTNAKGHSDKVSNVAFSADGSKLLTGSWDYTAGLWETKSGALLSTLDGHSDLVACVAFSSDGSKLLTGSWDKTARLWETKTGRILAILDGHTSQVNSVAFSPDGGKLLTGSWDKTACLWETKTGKLLRILEGHAGHVRSVKFSPDGSKVLTGSEDRTARLWETESGKLLAILEGHTGSINSVAFSPDGSKLLTVSWDETARLWEGEKGENPVILKGHIGRVTNGTFSQDGNLIITSDEYGYALLWHARDPRTGHLLGLYVTTYEVGAIYWQDATHVILADTGGPLNRPHLYSLKLEGIW